MKAKTRTVTVGGRAYVWGTSHRYRRSDDSYLTRLFFSPVGQKNKLAECFFRSSAHMYMGCHLNVGFLADRDGAEVEISLNHPGFICELIQHLLATRVDFSTRDRYRLDSGWELLAELGYHSFRTPYLFFPKQQD